MSDLSKVINDVLTAQAAKTTNDMSQTDVNKVAPPVTTAVNKEVKAIVTNLTNQEPWYKSRVIIGLGVSLALKAAVAAGWASDSIDADSLTNQILLLVSTLGDLYAMYGRLVVNKPIGE